MKSNIIINALLLGFMLLGANFANAATAITTKVSYVGTYGDGRMFVGVANTINEPGCAKARFDVGPQHAEISHWLETARIARQTGRSVVIRTSGCYAGYPTMNHQTNSYFYLK